MWLLANGNSDVVYYTCDKYGRQLASMSQGNTVWNFTYDSNGMRTQRTNGSVTYTYLYNGSQLTQMTRGSVVMRFSYGTDGRPLVIRYNDTPYYYITNLQGDVVAIVNSSGTTVVKYVYDAWGRVITTVDNTNINLGEINPLRYRGYVYDQETGLYYLQSRYYNPTWGRFINADSFVSTGQGLLGNNMFAYCGNNPVLGYDPTGTRVQLWSTLFDEHDPGFIHRAVQAHIIVSGLFEKELYLPGIGRADIYDPATLEIWEIKHGGNSAAMQNERMLLAGGQINRYIKDSKELNKRIYIKGHAGAFTGAFVINCGKMSCLVAYTTPIDGVILYSVSQMNNYEHAASYEYITLANRNQNKNMLQIACFAGAVGSLCGSMLWDPLCYKACQ